MLFSNSDTDFRRISMPHLKSIIKIILSIGLSIGLIACGGSGGGSGGGGTAVNNDASLSDLTQ